MACQELSRYINKLNPSEQILASSQQPASLTICKIHCERDNGDVSSVASQGLLRLPSRRNITRSGLSSSGEKMTRLWRFASPTTTRRRRTCPAPPVRQPAVTRTARLACRNVPTGDPPLPLTTTDITDQDSLSMISQCVVHHHQTSQLLHDIH